MVSDARSRIKGDDSRLPIERWHEALLMREELVSGVFGLDDDPEFAAREIAKGLSKRPNTDPRADALYEYGEVIRPCFVMVTLMHSML